MWHFHSSALQPDGAPAFEEEEAPTELGHGPYGPPRLHVYLRGHAGQASLDEETAE